MLTPGARSRLLAVLERSRAYGFLGPGPAEVHLDHALAFAGAWSGWRAEPPGTLLDLGSGGGVPGLVLAECWPSTPVTLLDSARRRTDFLRSAIEELGFGPRVAVTTGRAEELGHGALRGTFDAVTARGFAAPPVTAECGAAFLRPDGLLLVSEPPSAAASKARWPTAPLAALGLEVLGRTTVPAAVCVLRADSPLADHYPRRSGMPAKRPLWRLDAPHH